MPTAREVWTRAVNVEGKMFALRSATTAELADITADVNTSDEKVAGALVFNSTVESVVVATGADDNSVWNNIEAGTTVHTPI